MTSEQHYVQYNVYVRSELKGWESFPVYYSIDVRPHCTILFPHVFDNTSFNLMDSFYPRPPSSPRQIILSYVPSTQDYLLIRKVSRPFFPFVRSLLVGSRFSGSKVYRLPLLFLNPHRHLFHCYFL